MEKYIGTKEVIAEKMSEEKAILNGWARKNLDNHPMREGYHVRYSDGYDSWSPKEIFEKSYHLVETPLDRLELDKIELTEKVSKLAALLHSSRINSVQIKPQLTLLLRQYRLMQGYLRTINKRILLIKANGEE